MFPPIDKSVLENNPDFAHLYKTLKTFTLNPNGTTRADPSAKARAAVHEELDSYRLKAAKRHLLISAISTAVPESPPADNKPRSRLHKRAESQSQQTLPPELLDLLILLPPLLNHPPNPQSLSLLLSTPPLSDLPALLPALTPLVSTALHTNALSLARIASPQTNPSYLHRTIPNLPKFHADLVRTVADSKQALVKSRLDAAAALTTLMQSHVATLSHLVRSLEAKHGVVARSLELRAAGVALDAQKAEADAVTAKDGVRNVVYSTDVVKALGNYEAHLRDARMRLEQSVRDLKLELEGYGVGVEAGEGKERTMREMGRVYREMTKQMEDVKADLERLGRRG